MLESILNNESLQKLKKATRPGAFILGAILYFLVAGCEPINQDRPEEYIDYSSDPYSGMDVMKLVGYSSTNDNKSFSINGHIKNDSLATKKGTVNFILYNSEGDIITTDYTHAEPWEMEPGDVHTFSKTWSDSKVYQNVRTYDISTVTEQ